MVQDGDVLHQAQAHLQGEKQANDNGIIQIEIDFFKKSNQTNKSKQNQIRNQNQNQNQNRTK
jgi:hypothetical protein